MVSDHRATPCEPRVPRGLEDSVPLLLVTLLLVATSAPHQASCRLVTLVWLIFIVATAVSQMLAGYMSHVPGSQREGWCVNILWGAVGKAPPPSTIIPPQSRLVKRHIYWGYRSIGDSETLQKSPSQHQ